jgi:hypothetical protein
VRGKLFEKSFPHAPFKNFESMNSDDLILKVLWNPKPFFQERFWSPKAPRSVGLGATPQLLPQKGLSPPTQPFVFI